MTDQIPAALEQHLQHELLPGERVVWEGRPAPSSRALTGAGTFLLGIPFFAFALFWTWGATHQAGSPGGGQADSAWPAYLWGGMFAAVGATMLLAPLWESLMARRTLYAVTDRRAIVIEAAPWRLTVRSFTPEQLINCERHADLFGRGTLVFTRELVGSGRSRRPREIGFFGLADAQRVQRLLPAVAASA